jgi:predicted phosphodiesterase
MTEKTCTACGKSKPTSAFNKHAGRKDGLNTQCKLCHRGSTKRASDKNKDELANRRVGDVYAPVEAAQIGRAEKRAQDNAQKKAAERKARMDSDYQPLGQDNYETEDRENYTANVGEKPADYFATKKQEYSEAMGRVKDGLRDGTLNAQDGGYISRLAEDERRFMNRRLARSVSIAVARDELSLRRFRQAAHEHLTGSVTPTGYALKGRTEKRLKRTVNVLLSDMHFGSDLGSEQNPEAFGPVEESRRFGKVVHEVAEYKHGYRSDTHLNVLLTGDNVNGFLGHDLRDGAPLTEQFVRFLKYLRPAVGLWAQTYRTVDVHCVPGNHGRDIIRHPGRATNDKWDGEETRMHIALASACDALKNVKFFGTGLSHRFAYNVVDLYGSKMLQAHGDTEPKTQDPDTKAKENAAVFLGLNANQTYGHSFGLAVGGHWHKARVQHLRGMSLLFNGALCSPNGHARTNNYVNEASGQWLWESVEGYPLGDLRFITVGRTEDRDERLNEHIKPFSFSLAGM